MDLNDIEFKTEVVKISKVKNNPNNPRVIKDRQFEILVNSIKEFPKMLKIRPIVVNDDMIVLGGNQRLKACKEAGLKEVPIINVDKLTEDEQRQFIIKDNVSGGEWDWDMLTSDWDTEKLEEWGLEVPEDVAVEELEAEEDDYEMPEEVHTDIVLGDLFEIGEHRLLCGDSTNTDDVAKLMNGQKADMVFTDPPYGINHTGKGITAPTKNGNIVEGNNFGEILGDGNTQVAVDSFNLIYNLYSEAMHIWWGANYYASIIPNGYGWIVWDKERVGETFSGAELAFVNKGVRVDVFRHMWHGIAKASESGDKRLHPTQKPVALIDWCINNYAKESKYILDVFLGSGTTMVASHQLKRKCYGMELDPKYCQVIIDRMKKLDPSLIIKKNGTVIE